MDTGLTPVHLREIRSLKNFKETDKNIMKFQKVWLAALGILLVITVLLSTHIAWQNDLVTRSARQVELAVDFNEIIGLSRETGLPVSVVLERIVAAGVNSVGMSPISMDALQEAGRLSLFTPADVARAFQLTGKLPSFLDFGDMNGNQQPAAGALPLIYIVTEEALLAEKIAARLAYREEEFSSYYHGDMVVHVFKTTGSPADLLSLRLFLLPPEAEIIKEKGLGVVPRISNHDLTSPELLQGYMNIFQGFQVSTFIPEGVEVPGYPDFLPQTAHLLSEASWALGMVEFIAAPAGFRRLAVDLDYNLVRVHSNFLGTAPRGIVGSTQRRVRLLYVRFFLEQESLEAMDETVAFLQEITTGLDSAGFEIGSASMMLPPSRPIYLQVLLGAGSLAAVFLLLHIFAKSYLLWQVAAYLLGLLLYLALVFRNIILAQQMMALLTALVFPALAVILFQLGKKEKFPLLILLKTILLALAGGILVQGLLGEVSFFFGLSIFRGVKIAHAVPPLLLFLYLFYQQFSTAGLFKNLELTFRHCLDICLRPVRYGHLLALFLLLLFAAVYLGRTGHTAGIPVPDFEVWLRHILADLMVVRPRFKEFLIAYPLGILGLYNLSRGRKGVITYTLLLIGSIAPVSVVNTFSHVTIPAGISLIRTVNGFFLGSFLGIVLIIVVEILWRQLNKWQQRLKAMNGVKK